MAFTSAGAALGPMKYFIHAYGPNGFVRDEIGHEFSSEEEAVKDILSNIFAVAHELHDECEDLLFERLEITNETGKIVRTVTASDLIHSRGNS